MALEPYYAKVFMLLGIAGCVFYMKSTFYIPGDKNYKPLFNLNDGNLVKTSESQNVNAELKFILQWTSGSESFQYLGKGQEAFNKLNCPFTNCFVTNNRTLLPNIEEFDAIIFNANEVIHMSKDELPQERSCGQKYVFAGIDPHNLACNPELDNFFNWTWTYKLDSDVLWRYITIYDLDSNEVGPKIDMEWPEEMQPIDDVTRSILDGKSKAAAWFVANCKSFNQREDFVKEVNKELDIFDLSIDIYGNCGPLEVLMNETSTNNDVVEEDYFFYFSFEDSFSVDYVTEKLLTALDNYAVPVVLGVADYSRFLPPGSYLDARQLGPKRLAETMHDVITNMTSYYDFFRWRNHFQYERSDSSEICNICTALNNAGRVEEISTYDRFREWWNGKRNHLCEKQKPSN